MWRWIDQNRQWLFSGAGITALAIVVWFIKKLWPSLKNVLGRKKPMAGPVSSSSGTGTMISSQQLNISASPNINPSPRIASGISPGTRPSQPGAQTPRNEQDDAVRPNIGCLRPQLMTVVYDEESDVWSRGAVFPALVLPFSNDAQRGRKTRPVGDLKARLTYYQCDAIEEFLRIDSGCWVGEAYRSIGLGVGEIVYLIAAIQLDGRAGAVANPRYSAARYSEDQTSVDYLPSGRYDLKVSLTGGDYGDYTGEYWFTLEVGDRLGAERAQSRPAKTP